jgi:hypothetical protein
MSTPVLTCPDLTDRLTVEAWIETRHPLTEGLQALVSKWTPRAVFDGFSAFDASRTDGLDCRGYFGAVFDGRYVYFVPEHAPDLMTTHAVVLRYDTHAPFDEAKSYAAYDARSTAGLDTSGFYGGAFDGRYVYFLPRQLNCDYYHSRLLRLDTRGDFKDPNSWSAHDIGREQSAQGGAFDGRYLYLCPGYKGDLLLQQNGQCGNVIRYDTRAAFHDPDSYREFDLAQACGARAACFDGGAFDGRYAYFAPLENAVIARYDTQGEFQDPDAWQTFDALALGTSMFVGAVFDGRWMYFVAYNTGKIVRFDTRAAFQSPRSWQVFDAAGTSGLRCGGYDGGAFDGRYVYFVPFVFFEDKQFEFHADYLRYDTLKNFSDPASWQAVDAAHTSGLRSFGYNAGAFDGRYFYCAPWRQGRGRTAETAGIHGNVLRYDTLGEGGSFSLRACDYGHNGGLCASTPGPSFLINTADGRALGVASQRALAPGRHHIAGIYDGQALKLMIDGAVVAQRAATGTIQSCAAPVVTGCIEGGGGAFAGEILEARVSDRVEY